MKPTRHLTRRRAMKRKPDRIRWADGPERPFWKTPAVGVTAGVVILGVGAFTAHRADADARLAPPEQRGCDIVVVQPGDWATRLAPGVPLDTLAELNPHIPNLNLIFPGDELVTGCHPGPAAAVNEVQRATAPGLEQYVDEAEPCTVAGRSTTCQTWRSIIATLYLDGVRGNDLVTLAAITAPESGRAMSSVGDTDARYLRDGWLGSFGVFQIRSNAQHTGSGNYRDVERNRTWRGNAASAVEMYENAKQRRAQGMIHPVTKRVWTPFDDWSAYLGNLHVGHLDTVRAVAEQIGAL